MTDSVVFEGATQGTRWHVIAKEVTRGLSTTLVLFTDDGPISDVGMSGPALPLGSKLNVSSGGKKGGPLLVLVRCAPEVVSVRLHFENRTSTPMDLSPTTAFKVKLAVAVVSRTTKLDHIEANDAQDQLVERCDIRHHNDTDEEAPPNGGFGRSGRGGWRPLA